MPTTGVATNAHENAILNTARGTALSAWTPYAALFSTEPAEDGTGGVELSVAGYSRQSVTFGAPTDDGAGAQQMSNTNVITYGPLTADAPQVVAVGIFDAVSGGTLRYVITLTTPRDPATNDSLEFAAGTLTVKHT